MKRLVSLIVFAASLLGMAVAQDTDVHITPRDKRETQETAPAKSPNSSGSTFRSSSNLVVVPVIVRDRLNGRIIDGINPQSVKIFDNDVPQVITKFSRTDAPASVVFVLDESASMRGDKIMMSVAAIKEFMNGANSADEFSLVTLSDRPALEAGFTSDTKVIDARLAAVFPNSPNGNTSLLDGLYLSLQEMKDANKGNQKVILVFSDGGDNHSRYTEGEIREMVKEADTQIFAVVVSDLVPVTPEEALGPGLLEDIVKETGGELYLFIDNPLGRKSYAMGESIVDMHQSELSQIATGILNQVRSLYVLTYKPTAPPAKPNAKKKKDRWHSIKVIINLPKGFMKPLLDYKRGYLEE